MLPRLSDFPEASSSFLRFHGMLCGPDVARSCVSAFNGTILFMPASYDPDAFLGDRQAPLPHEVRSLTSLKYYALVLCSLTGFCSLLRLTEVISAQEVPLACSGGTRASHPLSVHPSVIDALARRHADGLRESVRLIRRYEFKFRLVGLWVAMHHYASTNRRGERTLSLVEVYDVPKVCIACAWAAVAVILHIVLRV